MPGTRFIVFAAAGLALTAMIGTAAAQGFGPPGAPPGGFGPPPGAQPGFGPAPSQPQQPGFVAAPSQSQQGMPPCANEFIPLRQEVEKNGKAVKAAIDAKADRAEICNGLKRFTAAEAKFIKYLETNAGWCGIPPDAIQQVKAGYGHSTKLRDRACAAGPTAGPRIAPGPGLSDALGTNRAAPDPAKKGAGTFDTLTGSTLKQ
jgi:hypothetical protein